MLGLAPPPVRRRPRVAVFSLRRRVVAGPGAVAPGKIRDANSYTLVGLIEQNGSQALNLGICADRPEAVRQVLQAAVDQTADLILSSAGVSVGALDLSAAWSKKMGSLTFWRVNYAPG